MDERRRYRSDEDKRSAEGIAAQLERLVISHRRDSYLVTTLVGAANRLLAFGALANGIDTLVPRGRSALTEHPSCPQVCKEKPKEAK